MDVFFYTIIVLFVFLAFFFICLGASLTKRLMKKLPDITAHAKTLSKRAEVYRRGALYYVAFEFDDGSRKSLMVGYELYNTIVEGETGTIKYKQAENKFLKALHVAYQPTLTDYKVDKQV